MIRRPISLRLRLVLMLLGIAAVLAIVLYFTVRTVADQAAEATQDGVLGAATLAIAESLQGGDEGVSVDLPYEAFSILGSISADRVFYRIDAGGETLTGYSDLPPPPEAGAAVTPVFYTSAYRDTEVRIAAVARMVLVARKPVPVLVMVAQTRQGQEAIAQRVAQRAAAIGLGSFVLAAALSLLTAGNVLGPINRLADAVGRRGPHDLRAVDHPTPVELRPLITALNGFIARLRGAISRTETFIAEAAHHIRTPLATVRARAEIAMRQSKSEEMRETLRAVIRAVEESSRSAGQLLDHATVVARSDRLADEPVDLTKLVAAQAEAFGPTAELKDLTISVKTEPVTVQGDRALIEAALRNLLDNAIKYSLPETTIDLVLTNDNAARIEVADRGRGLSGQQQGRLTKRFARGENAGDVIGSGLGLTIVAEVAAAHGGRFELTEREGGGTCARLYLPLA
ncbi:sensor histidine kinase N-terminal domain-containing protein [Defluviimonas sp. WL0050]|uniref:histidine kinase n=1 Tax=Albidovulum litorale TaxID=2984134 RepID=A0ABT2ZNA2_9RHOB|nr:sensor histidine kinase [Defluviimonas sp. WL0050]MCV2872573.1 sensor histidine kinase N-terminal domain-containing protein [Defluviimonas sp. WL0050]